MKNLNQWAQHCHKAAKENGWWNQREDMKLLAERFGGPHYLKHQSDLIRDQLTLLQISELTESMEARRNGKYAGTDFVQLDDPNFKENFKEKIKDTWEDEIADTFIRLFDMVGAYEIDIEYFIRAKLQYNATRGEKHGGKAY
jgi:hypothetical protein